MSDHDWKRTVLQATNELGTQVLLAGLLTGAITSGFLARCRETTTAAELAGATGLEHGVVDQVCDALRSAGVLDGGEDGQVVISDRYAPLLEGGLDQFVVERLTADGVRAKMLHDLFDKKASSSYWSIDSSSRLALAAAATANPETEFGRETIVAAVRANPDWHDAFTRGGRFLDLGCGIAGMTISWLHQYPLLTAVGIDIAEDVLEVARGRAQAIGVADRVTFLVADTTSFRDPEPFDVALWPQSFYPEPSRADALAAVFANLRPGGLLLTPTAPPPANTTLILGSLLRKLWGVQDLSFEELVSELQAAGFVDIAAAPVSAGSGVVPMINSRRPH